MIDAGLIPKNGDLPANRRLWRASSTFERNGAFNIHTYHMNTRSIYPFFFIFLLYGWWGHATFAWYKMRYEDNDEWLGNFYDKLNTRFPPPTKIWLRPGWSTIPIKINSSKQADIISTVNYWLYNHLCVSLRIRCLEITQKLLCLPSLHKNLLQWCIRLGRSRSFGKSCPPTRQSKSLLALQLPSWTLEQWFSPILEIFYLLLEVKRFENVIDFFTTMIFSQFASG